MISARVDISNGTRESIAEWGFSVFLVYPSGKTSEVTANGRKSSMTTNSEGMPIVNNKPYLSISVDQLTEGIPEKGVKVKVPADFFRPDPLNMKWYAVDNVSVTDEDWFVKIYLTETEQSA